MLALPLPACRPRGASLLAPLGLSFLICSMGTRKEPVLQQRCDDKIKRSRGRTCPAPDRAQSWGFWLCSRWAWDRWGQVCQGAFPVGGTPVQDPWRPRSEGSPLPFPTWDLPHQSQHLLLSAAASYCAPPGYSELSEFLTPWAVHLHSPAR